MILPELPIGRSVEITYLHDGGKMKNISKLAKMQHRPQSLFLNSCALLVLIFPSSAGALTELEAPLLRAPNPGTVRNLHILNLGNGNSLGSSPTSLRNLRNGIVDPETAVRSLLRNNLVDPLFGVKTIGGSRLGLTGRQVHQYQFTFSGFPLCDFSLKSHTRTGSDPVILGRAPGFGAVQQLLTIASFPSVESVVDQMVGSLDQGGGAGLVTEATRCLKYVDGELVPVLKVTMTSGGLPYTGTSDGNRLFSVEGKFFTVAGTVKAYKKNKLDAATATYTVDLIGDTHLTSTEITTATGSVPRATAADHKFEYTAADEEFAEANAFAHATSFYQWLKSLGYTWTTSKLTVRVREDIPIGGGEVTKNNALYVPIGYKPASGPAATGPVIAVADGDGELLRDLPTDSDVVTHEFGHHLLFRTLKSVGFSEDPADLDHSAVLHEGLADFFTFAYTGDSCLAESICPEKTPACWVMARNEQCLRSGSTDLTYGSELYGDLANHLKGQLVSGMMWDIRSRSDVDDEEFTKVAFASVDFLQESSTYTDWLVSLMSADKDLFDGKYGCKIVEAAKSRGFVEQVKDFDANCASFEIPTQKASGGTSGQSTKEGSSVDGGSSAGSQPVLPRSENKESNKWCGTISTGDFSTTYSVLILAILLLLPILAVAPRPVQVRVAHSPRRKDPSH